MALLEGKIYKVQGVDGRHTGLMLWVYKLDNIIFDAMPYLEDVVFLLGIAYKVEVEDAQLEGLMEL